MLTEKIINTSALTLKLEKSLSIIVLVFAVLVLIKGNMSIEEKYNVTTF